MIACDVCGKEFESARQYSAHTPANCRKHRDAKRAEASDLVQVTGDESIGLHSAGIPYDYQTMPRAGSVGTTAVPIAPRWAVLAYRAILAPASKDLSRLFAAPGDLAPEEDSDTARLLKLVIARGVEDEDFRAALATVCEAEPSRLGPWLIAAGGITPAQWMTPPTCAHCERAMTWRSSDASGSTWQCANPACREYAP